MMLRSLNDIADDMSAPLDVSSFEVGAPDYVSGAAPTPTSANNGAASASWSSLVTGITQALPALATTYANYRVATQATPNVIRYPYGATITANGLTVPNPPPSYVVSPATPGGASGMMFGIPTPMLLLGAALALYAMR